MTGIWILTREVNEYDQYGEYFEAAFPHRPSFEELETLMPKIVLKPDRELIDHVFTGGGRRGTEYEWFRLFEYDE